MEYLPLVAFAAIIVLFVLYAGRQRRRQQTTRLEQAESIVAGTEVMTTSGLYGTVVNRNPDDTVMLAIAPGIEVKWELAALRDLDTLPEQFRGRPGAAPARGASDVSLEKGESDGSGGVR